MNVSISIHPTIATLIDAYEFESLEVLARALCWRAYLTETEARGEEPLCLEDWLDSGFAVREADLIAAVIKNELVGGVSLSDCLSLASRGVEVLRSRTNEVPELSEAIEAVASCYGWRQPGNPFQPGKARTPRKELPQVEPPSFRSRKRRQRKRRKGLSRE